MIDHVTYDVSCLRGKSAIPQVSNIIVIHNLKIFQVFPRVQFFLKAYWMTLVRFLTFIVICFQKYMNYEFLFILIRNSWKKHGKILEFKGVQKKYLKGSCTFA